MRPNPDRIGSSSQLFVPIHAGVGPGEGRPRGEGRVGTQRLHVVAEEVGPDLRPGADRGRGLRRRRQCRIRAHLDRGHRVAHLGAVRGDDAGRPHELVARLAERGREVGVVARRRELGGERAVVDARRLLDADAGDAAAVEVVAVGDQVGGLVVDPAVEVHAALVGLMRPVRRARHAVRAGGAARWGERRILHVAQRPAVDVLEHLPARRGVSLPRPLVRSMNSPQMSEKDSLMAPDWKQ